MNKKLPIGISDFKILISNDYYFVDKSLISFSPINPYLLYQIPKSSFRLLYKN